MMQTWCRNWLFGKIVILRSLVLLLACAGAVHGVLAQSQTSDAPTPLLEAKHPVDWWFVFKFNAQSFPACGASAVRECPFGGDVQDYTFGQQYVYASSEDASLKKGGGCVGATSTDPVGATFGEIYGGSYYYVVWNDQFYGDPSIAGCGNSCGGPWGHSKGMIAWNDSGEGVALQVTTPSWPASGNRMRPRNSDGNTLGCVKDDNVLVSQHFFSVRLTKVDLIEVLKAIGNASVVTDVTNRQLVNNGGPQDVQDLVKRLGKKVTSNSVLKVRLSTGVGLLSKPSKLNVPPWQMVSAELGGVPLRAATWWANPYISSTTATTPVVCWDQSLGSPGAVEIAISGSWDGTAFGLKGGSGPNFNHAKIGVSTSGQHSLAIFGDMNQQGTLAGSNCASSQNGRGGLFYIIESRQLSQAISDLIKGETAPVDGK